MYNTTFYNSIENSYTVVIERESTSQNNFRLWLSSWYRLQIIHDWFIGISIDTITFTFTSTLLANRYSDVSWNRYFFFGEKCMIILCQTNNYIKQSHNWFIVYGIEKSPKLNCFNVILVIDRKNHYVFIILVDLMLHHTYGLV